MNLTMPLAGFVYAGLAGTLIALVVATATNRWSPRVFFLLALRLAIGWHFMFEGFHKIHSHSVGLTDTSRPFSSEPYFKVAPGPLGEQMRRGFSDPAADIAAKVRAPKEIAPADFKNRSAEEQAAECPRAVADQLDKLNEQARAVAKAEAEADIKAANADEEKVTKDATDAEAVLLRVPFVTSAKAEADNVRAKAKAEAEKARAEAQERLDSFEKVGDKMVTAAKASYARWVYGVDVRPAKVKFITGDVLLTGPQRLEHLAWVKAQANEATEPLSLGLGTGTGTDSKRVAEFRTAAMTAEADLARDANEYIDELKKGLGFKPEPARGAPELSRGQWMDKITMWFLVVVGAMLMFGLFTRVSCVLAAGFLVMTYLAHPAFPWYPLPPNTEGNPVFINKNIIEALALLAIATFPTGRWLGLDAIVLRPLRPYRRETSGA